MSQGILLLVYGWLSKLGSLLGTLNNRCRIIIGTPKGTIILTTTHIIDPNHKTRYPKKGVGHEPLGRIVSCVVMSETLPMPSKAKLCVVLA